jgi:MFS family permease
MTMETALARRRVASRAIGALGVTQTIAWGTTYYLPAVFSERLQADLGLSSPEVFAGVAVMLLTSAAIAWPVGRLLDRDGAGRSMPAGSLFLAAGLVMLGLAQGLATYALAWVFFGVGMALAMGNATMSALAQIAGQGARRGMVIVMLFGGMAASVFWPLTLWLDGLIGWRATCFAFAGLHVLVCAPLHLLFLANATSAERRRDLAADEPLGLVPPEKRRLAAVLVTVAIGGNGFVSWGLDLHLIAILKEFGLSAAAAVAIAAWKGPATLMARALDIAAAQRITPMGSAVAAGALMVAGIATPLAYSAGMTAAIVFITVYSFGAGLMSIVRNALPLVVLGSLGYAITLGRLTLPTQIVFALSPMTCGLMLERLGLTATLWIALAATLVSFAALVMLSRLVRPAAA